MTKHWRSQIPSLVFIAFACSLFLPACKKDSLITSKEALLTTSLDSLKYDTVFTSIGSVTQSFKINNPNNQRLALSRIKLMGGTGSPFRLNINGVASQEVQGLEIQAEDSIYVFVTVQIDPGTGNLPFLVRDSILIEYNGNSKFVQLEAFGQNANFLRHRIIKGSTTWTNNLPYVILGSLVIDTAATLTIDKGCRIFSHADAPFIVDGTLLVNGSSSERVVFTGDRLENIYKDLPASWPGIYFRGSSTENHLQFTSILNAYQAIVAERHASNATTKLNLQQCVIDNAYDAGLLAVNSSIKAESCLITNCGSNISFSLGGIYELIHCTVAAYPTLIEHKKPLLSLSNFFNQTGNILTANLDAQFTNCIFWAESNSVENETQIEQQGAGTFNVVFTNCLLKGKDEPAKSSIIASLRNEDPLFDSVDVANRYFDFHTNLNPAAPGINKGKITSLAIDLEGKSRNVGLPDLGCYEKQ